MITYKEFNAQELDKIKEIYRKENWLAYLHDDDSLKRAIESSLYCLGAYDEEELIGFVRCVGDGEHIVLIQDLIVTPEYQNKKVGTTLMKMVWDRYAYVRMFQVNTDADDQRANHFYQAFGMKSISEGNMISYFRF